MVTVNAGTLQGNGSSTAAITIGTGSGAGAIIAPGNSIGTITTTGALSLKSDATYSIEINSATSTIDQIVANGVALINPTLTLTDLGTNTALTVGNIYTIINNTSATPISGTFKNMGEGSTFVLGVNTFKVSYVGGDGNDVTLTVVNAILPLNLISFTGQLLQNNTLSLNFTSNAEVSLGSFVIEKSNNGIDFSPIGNVVAKNTLAINNYAFTDVSPFAGNNYYRLKMVDKDGTFSYSKVVLINMDALQPITLTVFPNPAINNIAISHTKAGDGAVLKIYNSTGKLLLTNIVPNGAITTNIDVTMLINCYYTLAFINGDKTVTAAFVK